MNRLRNKKFVNNSGYDKRKIIELAFKGGFPEPLLHLDPADIKE